MQRFLLTLALVSLTACSLAPDYKRPEVAFKDQWEDAPAAAKEAPARWWENFGSNNLNQLVTTALAQNNDLAAAIARVDEARAGQKIADASLYPQIDASASTSRTYQNSTAAGSGTTNQSQAGLNVSYELDLFGANRSARDAAKYGLAASQYERDSLAIVTAAQVTEAYFGLLASSDSLKLAQENLADIQQVSNIIEAQFKAGRVSGIESAQQRAQLATTQASVTNLTNSHALFRHLLAVLVGAAPQGYAPSEEALHAIKLPEVAPTLPSTLITQRPDIRAAESQLQAANADIGAARAAFFPAANLGAAALLIEGASPISLTASLLAPIFHGGALTGQLESTKAREMELAANYRQTVLIAFQETSDALSTLQNAKARQGALAEAATQSQQAYKLALARYKAGDIDFQTLLDTERTLFAAQDSYVAGTLDLLNATTDLYKAIGGPV